MFNVVRYFDDHCEGVVSIHLTKQDADVACDKLNKLPRAYVNYEVQCAPKAE